VCPVIFDRASYSTSTLACFASVHYRSSSLKIDLEQSASTLAEWYDGNYHPTQSYYYEESRRRSPRRPDHTVTYTYLNDITSDRVADTDHTGLLCQRTVRKVQGSLALVMMRVHWAAHLVEVLQQAVQVLFRWAN
jgi:hypothetical protein